MAVVSGTETASAPRYPVSGVTHQSQTGRDASRVLSEACPGFHKEVTCELKSERLVAG